MNASVIKTIVLGWQWWLCWWWWWQLRCKEEPRPWLREMVRRPWPPSKAIAGDDDLDDDEEEDYDDGDLKDRFDTKLWQLQQSQFNYEAVGLWASAPSPHEGWAMSLYFVLLQNHKRWKDRSLAGRGFEILITSKIVRMQSCPLTVMMLFIYQTRVWSERGPVNKSLTHWLTYAFETWLMWTLFAEDAYSTVVDLSSIYMLADVEMNDSFVTQFGDRWEPFYHFTSQPGVMSACFVVVTKVILAKALKTRVRFFFYQTRPKSNHCQTSHSVMIMTLKR